MKTLIITLLSIFVLVSCTPKKETTYDKTTFIELFNEEVTKAEKDTFIRIFNEEMSKFDTVTNTKND
jgi:hypothetical protein